MTKKQERELFFKALFMTEFYGDTEEIMEQADLFLEHESSQKSSSLISERVARFLEVLPQIDDQINSLAEGWKTSRIAKVDLTLLRMAIFEIRWENLAKGIAINEAVELAKAYGEERSYAFVNGILSKVDP